MDINKVDSAWLSAAIYTYEACRRKNAWKLDDIYFQQSDINRLAEKLIGSEMRSAMVSTHVCAYSSNCAYNYLTSRDKVRRISYSGEFNNVKERPALNSDLKIKTADDEITYGELCDFVDNEYSPRVVQLLKEKYDEFDFELIFKFIEEFGGRKYSSVDKAEDVAEEQEMQEIKEKGIAAREMFSAIGDELKSYMTKYKKLDISLWKGTWHYVNNYLWAQFRKGGKEEFLSSISISIEKNNDIYEMRVGVETRDNKCTQHEYDLHNRLLNKERTDESLKYYVDGDLPTQLVPLDLSSDEMKKKIEEGKYKKALISTVMYRDDMKEKDSIEIFKFIIESFNKLEPYYDLAVDGDRSDFSGKQNNDGLNEGEKENGDERNGEAAMKNDLLMNKNIILSGPPGTGKTYNSVNYSVAIIENKDLQAVMGEDYTEVFERYKEYKEKGQIYFTTFHQSYGYEEFIEGLKPVLAAEESDDDERNLEYKIEDGIFKELCKKASTISGEIDSIKIPDDASVWKISLYGARENKIKTECFEDSVIRIGWDNNDCKKDDQFIESLDSVVNKGTIKAFKEEMRIGDIVVSLYDHKTIDGIGIITSDYYYDKENIYSEYKRVRKVKWLAKNIKEDIYDLNGSIYLTQKAIYELTRIKVSDIINLLDKIKRQDKNGQIESLENVKRNDKRYVMIIDEINRGNISKIFGELITLIEPSKRGGAEEEASAILPYSKTPFTVPDNVYILGSMNTADRSIAIMDTALRRRFKFVEMMPDSSLFEGVRITEDKSGAEGPAPSSQGGSEIRYIDMKKMIDAVNARIEYLYDREHTIGHAYFMVLKKNPSLDLLCDIFEKSIIPLLQEYFYEDYEKIQLILGDNDKADEYKFILDEKLDIRSVFKGRDMSNIEADIPQKKYKINHDAFKKIESYIEIY